MTKKRIKIVVVGNENVGKTSFLYHCLYGEPLIAERLPEALFYSYLADIEIDEKFYSMVLAEPPLMSDDRIKRTDYSKADLFIVMFSVIDPHSYHAVRNIWVPELRGYCTETPMLLVGNKTDLRNNPETLNNLYQQKRTPIATKIGKRLAEKINAVKYLECSSLKTDTKEMKRLFEVANRAAIGILEEKHKNLMLSYKIGLVSYDHSRMVDLIWPLISEERFDVFGKPINQDSFHDEVAKNCTIFFEIDGEEYCFVVVDTFNDVMVKDRKSIPQNTDLIIVVFPKLDNSFRFDKATWTETIHNALPNTPKIVLGNQTNQNGQHILSNLDLTHASSTTTLGENLAKDINATGYFENPRSDGAITTNLFEEIIWGLLRHFEKKQKNLNKKRKKRFRIFGRKLFWVPHDFANNTCFMITLW